MLAESDRSSGAGSKRARASESSKPFDQPERAHPCAGARRAALLQRSACAGSRATTAESANTSSCSAALVRLPDARRPARSHFIVDGHRSSPPGRRKERRRQGHRIRPLVNRELHRRQHDARAREQGRPRRPGPRRRGACPRTSRATWVRNEASRSALTRLTTAPAKPRSPRSTARRARAPGAQRGAHRSHLVEDRGAVVAPFEVSRDGNLIADRQLSIAKGVQPATRGRAGEDLHAVRSPRSSRRSAWRARVSRDFTVPTATPSENAISS